MQIKPPLLDIPIIKAVTGLFNCELITSNTVAFRST